MAKPKSAYVQERLAQLAAALPKADPKPADPVFDPERPFATLSNNQRVQLKWLFSPGGDFLGEAERCLWTPELTPEQLREHKTYLARQRAKAAAVRKPPRGAPPPVPQKVIDNARENAAALHAEALAE